MGLEFGHQQGAKFVMRRLYERGVWAIFSTLDPRVLQYKPGLLLDQGTCARILAATEAAICDAREGALAGAARDNSKTPPAGRPSAPRPGTGDLSRPNETGT